MKDLEVERVWREFWRPMLCAKSGRPIMSRIKRELADYRMCIDEVSKVYDEVTCGRLSKPNTLAQYVIDAVNEIRERDIKEAISEKTSENSEENKEGS